MASRNPHAVQHLLDCNACKKSYSAERRSSLMSCGYEAPIEGSPRWKHEGYRGGAPSTCVGYLCGLPDVVQISRRRLHWERGNAADVQDERERVLIEELVIQSNQAEGWSIRKRAEESKAGR